MFWKRIAFIGLVITLLAGACGGLAGPKEAKIAVVLPRNRSYGQAMENSINLALEEAGHQAGDVAVELLILDSTDPQVNPDDNPFASDVETKLVQRAIDDSEVVVYLGTLGSDQAKATMATMNQANLAQISPSASWPGLTKPGYGPGEPGIYFPTGRRHFFRMSASDDAQGAAAARWTKELGLTKVYVVHDMGTYSSGLAGIFQITAQDLGLEIVGSQGYDWEIWTAQDREAIIAQAIESGAEMIYFPAASSDSVGIPEFISQVKTLDPDMEIMGGDGIANQLVDEVPPEHLEGLMATDISVVARDLEGEAAAAFAEKYQSTYGEELTSSLGTAAYEAMGLMLQAIENAEEPSREGVVEQLRSMEYSGIYGTWGFDDHGDMTPAVVSVLQVQDGEWVFVQVVK